MLSLEQRLGLAVAALLLQVGGDGAATMVPDHSRRGVGDALTFSHQAPTHVHVVAGLDVERVEPAQLHQALAPEGHVAARHVLGLVVVDEDVGRRAWAGLHAGSHRPVVRRQQVGAAHARGLRVEQLGDQEVEPVRIGKAVIVGVGDDLACGQVHADVTRHRKTFVRLPVVAHRGKARGDVRHAVRRAVVDQQDFVVGIVKFLERFERPGQRLPAVVAADDHGDLRIARECRQGAVAAEDRGDFVERRLGRAIASDQPKGPVADRMPAREPLVRERKHARPGQTAAEDLVEVHGDQLGLLLVAVSDRVDAVLAQDQRSLVCLVRQALQVAAELLALVQVDVHGVEVHVARPQVLRGWVAREGHQRVRVFLTRHVGQLVDEALDACRSEPTYDVGRDLVDDAEREHGRMRAASLGRGAHVRAARFAIGRVLEETAVLRPGHIDEHLEPEGVRGVEQLARRHMIDANRVRSQAADEAEVGFHLMQRRQRDA